MTKGLMPLEDELEMAATAGVGVNLTEPQVRHIIRSMRSQRQINADCLAVLAEAKEANLSAKRRFRDALILAVASVLFCLIALVA